MNKCVALSREPHFSIDTVAVPRDDLIVKYFFWGRTLLVDLNILRQPVPSGCSAQFDAGYEQPMSRSCRRRRRRYRLYARYELNFSATLAAVVRSRGCEVIFLELIGFSDVHSLCRLLFHALYFQDFVRFERNAKYTYKIIYKWSITCNRIKLNHGMEDNIPICDIHKPESYQYIPYRVMLK